ncbi:MAG: glycosyltransferase family 39 protein [Lachnospiraceae bacterium]|nr:glycosyltransferase family 39 protein [Lachnospiraceae bacterium]
MNKKINAFFNALYLFLLKYGVYIAALAVVLLNVSLIFDNVLWGDEAFSGNVIRGTDYKGLYERVYYLENHPILYYAYLKIFYEIFGQVSWIYHLASVIPFIVGIILCVTVIKKHLGSIPSYFFIFITGLSATCVEYNLEIRMYALCFAFILIATLFSIKIFEKEKKSYWVWLVIFSVLSAYTHYYGLVTSGILVFSVSLVYFLKNRGKTYLYGIISIASYIVLYLPWLPIFFIQTGRVKNNWWADKPEKLSNVIRFLLGGGRTSKILTIVAIIAVLFYLNKIFNVLVFKKIDKRSVNVSLNISLTKKENLDYLDYSLFSFALTSVLVISFAYLVCLIINPILEIRYMHPLMPVVLVGLVILIKKFVKDEKKVTTRLFIIGVLLILLFGAGLLDFKHFRSVTKVEEANTEEILNIVGTPSEDAVFTSAGVKHLAWTVLKYYYPDNEVFDEKPYNLEGDFREIWAYLDPVLYDDELALMKEKGYEVTEYLDKWMGKYHCHLYHFEKRN